MIELNAERKLNIEKLAKGDYISLEVLREVTGLDPGENSDLYRLALLGIRGKIERERKFTTRGDVYAIRILTDSEAVYQNEKTREHGIKKMERAYTRATAIDENALDDLTAKKHRLELEKHSKILATVGNTIKQIRSEKAAEKSPRNHSDSKAKIISNKESIDGTEASQRNTNGHFVVDLSQYRSGESAQPDSQANERANQQAQQN